MATTTLIFENIVIGAFAWSWIVVLLIRFNPITCVQLTSFSSAIRDSPAPLGVVFLLLVYPVGSMTNTICYALARRLFAEREEKKILRRFGLEDKFDDLISGLKFAGQNGTEQLYEDLQVFRPFMRISRAAAFHFFILGWAILFCFGPDLKNLIMLSFGMCILAAFACWYSYRFQNEEIAKACLVILESKKGSKPERPSRGRLFDLLVALLVPTPNP